MSYISCESSAWQMIYLNCQGLFSMKKKTTKKNLKVSSAAVVTGALGDINGKSTDLQMHCMQRNRFKQMSI